METLILILWIIAAVVVVIGLIRVIFAPYTGFVNLLLEFMLIDWLADLLGVIFSAIGDILDND